MKNKYKVLMDTVIQGRPMLKDEFTHLTDEEAAPYKDAGLVSGGSATSETVVPKNDAPQTGEAETGAVKKKAAK